MTLGLTYKKDYTGKDKLIRVQYFKADGVMYDFTFPSRKESLDVITVIETPEKVEYIYEIWEFKCELSRDNFVDAMVRGTNVIDSAVWNHYRVIPVKINSFLKMKPM